MIDWASYRAGYEVCRPAALAPVTRDQRYAGIHPDRWPWEMTGGSYDVAVLSHVIEHMKSGQLERLIAWLARSGVNVAYVEAPLRDKPRTWHRSDTGHVLEVGWTAVIAMFAEHGYAVRERTSYSVPGHPDRHVLIFGQEVAA